MALDALVDSTQLDADLTSVANAIRTKGGTSAQLAFPADFVSAIEDIETGGGGGEGYTLLASGSYTLSADGTTMTIPVSITGTMVLLLVEKDDVTSGVAQTYAWARVTKYFDEEVFDTNFSSGIAQLLYRNTSNTIYAASLNSQNQLVVYVNAFVNPTQLIVGQYSSNYKIKSGKYNWYVWGYTT